jgi:hypothetical protein
LSASRYDADEGGKREADGLFADDYLCLLDNLLPEYAAIAIEKDIAYKIFQLTRRK